MAGLRRPGGGSGGGGERSGDRTLAAAVLAAGLALGLAAGLATDCLLFDWSAGRCAAAAWLQARPVCGLDSA